MQVLQRKALEDLQRSCDPVTLMETVRPCQASLASLSAGQAHQVRRTLSRFLRNLQLLWQESQPMPEPRQKRRYTPRQRTLFLEHREQIEEWLEREATMNAAEILRRLIRLALGTYHEGQLRSMERRVKEWRTARAERLLGSEVDWFFWTGPIVNL